MFLVMWWNDLGGESRWVESWVDAMSLVVWKRSLGYESEIKEKS